MKIVDANVLLNATNLRAPAHQPARRWLESALSGADAIGFPWLSLTAFVRISTRPGAFDSPLSATAAMDQVDAWLARRLAMIVAPTSEHAAILRRMLEVVPVAGNMVSDAHLAALAIEHQAEIASFDRDFDRFPGVRRFEPA